MERLNSVFLDFLYGGETCSQLASRMAAMDLIPEILLDGIAGNLNIWFDNFIKTEFSSSSWFVCSHTFLVFFCVLCFGAYDPFLRKFLEFGKKAHRIGSFRP